MSDAPVRAPRADGALTPAQRRALLAMLRDPEVDATTIARRAGLKPNGAGLALRALERRGLVVRHGEDAKAWTVTFAGHALAQRLDRA